MTMPDERLRAIHWGRELLSQISGDAALAPGVVAAAQQIAMRYPARAALEDWLRSGAAGLPARWTSALLQAVELFETIHVAGSGSEHTRRDLRFTLRHFPDPTTVRVMGRAAVLGDWLQLVRGSS